MLDEVSAYYDSSREYVLITIISMKKLIAKKWICNFVCSIMNENTNHRTYIVYIRNVTYVNTELRPWNYIKIDAVTCNVRVYTLKCEGHFA